MIPTFKGFEKKLVIGVKYSLFTLCSPNLVGTITNRVFFHPNFTLSFYYSKNFSSSIGYTNVSIGSSSKFLEAVFSLVIGNS